MSPRLMRARLIYLGTWNDRGSRLDHGVAASGGPRRRRRLGQIAGPASRTAAADGGAAPRPAPSRTSRRLRHRSRSVPGGLEPVAEYLANPAMPFSLWLRSPTGQKPVPLHRHHLQARMRDAGREISLHRGAMPEASSAALAAQLLGRDTRPSEAAMRI